MISKVPEYLENDRLRHIDMLETLHRNMGGTVYADDDGVMVYSETGCVYMLSTESEETLEKMCGLISAPELMTVHQARFVPYLREKYRFRYTMECLQCAYLRDERPETKTAEDIELGDLTLNDARFVLENYDHPADLRYIAERIQAGMIGAFVDGKPAGFIGTHAEGTMGILQVLPGYRRRGIAGALETAMINRMLDKGWVPHGHIVTDNEASIKLQERLGMSFSDKTVTWLYNE